MPPINDKEEKAIKELVVLLRAQGVGFEEIISSLQNLRNSVDETTKKWAAQTEQIGRYVTVARTVVGSLDSVTQAANKVGNNFGAMEMSMSNAQNAAIKFRQSQMDNIAAFMRAGGSVNQFNNSIAVLTEQYKLTGEEATKLIGITSKAFIGMGVDQANKQMQELLRHTRNNVQATEALTNAMSALQKKSLDARAAGTDFAKLALAATAGGDMEQAMEFLEQSELKTASAGEKAKLDKIAEPLQQNKAVQAAFDEKAREMGEMMLYARGKLIDLAGGIDNFANALARSAQVMAGTSGLLGGVVSGAAGIGNLVGGIADISRAVGGIKKYRAAKALEAASGIAKPGFLRRAAGFGGRMISGAGSMIGSGLRGAARLPGKMMGKIGGKAGIKAGAKMLGKTALKAIPGVGLIAGAGFAIDRFMKGDMLGGLGEAASGIVSLLPGLGTAASIAIDAGLAARDIAKDAQQEVKEDKKTEAAEGAVVETPELSKEDAEKNRKEGALAAKLKPVLVELNTINLQLEAQQGLLDSINSLNSKQLANFAAIGDTQGFNNALAKEEINVAATRVKNAEKIAQTEKLLTLVQQEYGENSQSAMQVQAEINKLRGFDLDLLNRASEIAKQRIERDAQHITLINAKLGRMQAELNLIDNMGMGLGASVQARQQMVEMTMKEAQLQQESANRAEEEMIKAQKDSKDMSKSEEERNAASKRAIEMETIFEEKRTKVLEATTKAAEMTKKMREGWIQSIAFMTTGAGAFQRIVVSQNQNLGLLDKTRRDTIATLKYGQNLREGETGKEVSDKFINGTLQIGEQSSQVQKLLEQQGISTDYNKIRENIKKTVENQKKAAQSGVGPAAAFGAGPATGTAGVPMDAGMTKIGSETIKDANKGMVSELSKITTTNKSELSFNSEHMQKLKQALVEAFTEIVTEAKRDVLNNLRQSIN